MAAEDPEIVGERHDRALRFGIVPGPGRLGRLEGARRVIWIARTGTC